MKNIELRHLRLVKSIIDKGSMANATQQMFLTQSALSHMLKELETNLGVKLFSRTGKKLRPTEAGNIMLTHAENILGEFAALEKALINIQSLKKEKIRVSTSCYTSYHWLPAVVKLFREQVPDVSVDINMDATQQPLDFLENGKLDIAITDAKPLLPATYRINVLFEDEFVLVVSKDSRYAKLKNITTDALDGAALFIYDMDEKKSTAINGFIYPNHIRLSGITKMQSTEGLIEMVAADLGITIMPTWMVYPYVKQGKVVSLPLPHKRLKRKWYAISLKNAGKAQQLFVQLLQNELQNNRSYR